MLVAVYIWRQEVRHALVFLIATCPVVVLFLRWALAVWRQESAADFDHTMRMNQVSSLCLSTAFLLMLLW